MSKRKLFISIVAAILVLATVTCCFVSCVNFKDIFNQSGEETSTDNTPGEGDELVVESVENGVSFLALSPMGSTYLEGPWLTQSITAQFTGPEPAIKTLKWSLDWANPDEHPGEHVGDYVELHQNISNELSYDIRCYAGFDGEMILTATTLDGKYSATATIGYRGAPQWINLVNQYYTEEYVSDWNKSMFVLNAGIPMSFDIELDNTFHDVRMDFTLGAVNAAVNGGMIFEKVEYDSAGDVVATEIIECPLLLSDEGSADGTVSAYYQPFVNSDYADTQVLSLVAYVQDETFHVGTFDIYTNAAEVQLLESGGKIVCTPIGFINNQVPYVSLQVVEGNGMTGTVEVAIAAPDQCPIQFTNEYIWF